MRSYTPKNVSLIPTHAQKVFSGVIFDVYQWDQEQFDASTKTFEMIKRPDTVEIIAINGDKIIVTNERQPHIDEAYISIPAGMHDKENENELQAAKRELAEETGYYFKNWKLIRAVQAGSGKIEHIIYTFLATELESVGAQMLDAGEQIEVIEMTFEKFKKSEGIDNMRFYPSAIMHSADSLSDLLSLPSLHNYAN